MYDREIYYIIEVLFSVLCKCILVSLVGKRHHKSRCIKGDIGLGLFILQLGSQMTVLSWFYIRKFEEENPKQWNRALLYLNYPD